MSTTLQRRPGTSSGRIKPTGWTPPGGEYVLVLGCDEPGREGYFLPGDEVRVSQSADFGASRFVRSPARLRGPTAAPPAGWSWEAFCVVGGTEVWAFELLPGQTLDLEDLAAGVTSFAGVQDLQFGLRVVGTGTEPANLEVPAFYLDALVLDEASEGLLVRNRSPEPGAVDVSQGAEISFDLMDTTSAADPALTQVWVDGVLAYDGADGAQPGYAVSVTTVYAGTVRFTIAAPYLFESLREVPVRVVSANADASHELDTSWSFTVEDLTAPLLVGAVSRSHDVVRVTFDEPVEGALEASSYDFELLEAPAVSVEAVSVSEVSPREYDVTLDIPITRGALYRVVVQGVTDLDGNAIASPYDRAEFRGYECPPVPGRRFELWQMIPEENRRQDVTRDLYKTIAVLQEVVDLLLCDVDRWTDILDVDVAAERYLDQRLVYLGNPFDFDLVPDEKRRLIRTLVDMYQLKGTRVGVVSVVRFFLGIEIDVVPFTEDSWILGVSELGVESDLAPGTSRERYSFDVVSPVLLTEEQVTQITTIVTYMKPPHTHLIRIREPEAPILVDHLELGLSVLGDGEWMLH